MNAVTHDPLAIAAAAPVKPKRKLPPRGVLVLGAALVVGGAGYGYIHAAKGSATTDNAYVKTDVTVVAPRVRGHVAQVLVADNQPVRAGQVLVRLDLDEYAARVAAAEGDVALADAAVAAAQAALGRLATDEAVAAAQVREAETGIRAADAEVARARADWGRYEALLKTGYAPRRDADRVETQAVAAAALDLA
ncbi:HlyD family secretion protein, partial [Phenylobacterium sp.]|uniref:HlyD family secretion protein n=1 Tax=Phenylobacterium sp. TaxID=1871053 RepID=UPI002ED781AD